VDCRSRGCRVSRQAVMAASRRQCISAAARLRPQCHCILPELLFFHPHHPRLILHTTLGKCRSAGRAGGDSPPARLWSGSGAASASPSPTPATGDAFYRNYTNFIEISPQPVESFWRATRMWKRDREVLLDNSFTNPNNLLTCRSVSMTWRHTSSRSRVGPRTPDISIGEKAHLKPKRGASTTRMGLNWQPSGDLLLGRRHPGQDARTTVARASCPPPFSLSIPAPPIRTVLGEPPVPLWFWADDALDASARCRVSLSLPKSTPSPYTNPPPCDIPVPPAVAFPRFTTVSPCP